MYVAVQAARLIIGGGTIIVVDGNLRTCGQDCLKAAAAILNVPRSAYATSVYTTSSLSRTGQEQKENWAPGVGITPTKCSTTQDKRFKIQQPGTGERMRTWGAGMLPRTCSSTQDGCYCTGLHLIPLIIPFKAATHLINVATLAPCGWLTRGVRRRRTPRSDNPSRFDNPPYPRLAQCIEPRGDKMT